jgi:hypothetical protein
MLYFKRHFPQTPLDELVAERRLLFLGNHRLDQMSTFYQNITSLPWDDEASVVCDLATLLASAEKPFIHPSFAPDELERASVGAEDLKWWTSTIRESEDVTSVPPLDVVDRGVEELERQYQFLTHDQTFQDGSLAVLWAVGCEFAINKKVSVIAEVRGRDIDIQLVKCPAFRPDPAASILTILQLH